MTARRTLSFLTCALLALAASAARASDDAARLVEAMLGETPLIEDLRVLTDEIGGRATGSPANVTSVQWAVETFQAAEVDARTEPFEMPALWLESSAAAVVEGSGVRFAPRVAAMPYSAETPEGGTRAPLVDAADGAAEAFARLGEASRRYRRLICGSRLLRACLRQWP